MYSRSSVQVSCIQLFFFNLHISVVNNSNDRVSITSLLKVFQNITELTFKTCPGNQSKCSFVYFLLLLKINFKIDLSPLDFVQTNYYGWLCHSHEK